MGDVRDPALLRISFDFPKENIMLSCPRAPSLPVNDLWGMGFLVLHSDEREAGFTDFEMVKEGPLWAKKTISQTKGPSVGSGPRLGTSMVEEVLDLRLIHVPQ